MRKTLLVVLLSLWPALGFLALFQYLIQGTHDFIFFTLLGAGLILSGKLLFLLIDKTTLWLKAPIDNRERGYIKTFFALTYFFSYLTFTGGTIYFKTVLMPERLQQVRLLSSSVSSSYPFKVSHSEFEINNKEISVTPPDLKGPDLKKLSTVYRVLSKELGKYPKDFFEKIGLKNIFIGKDILFYGEASGGYANGWKGFFVLDLDVQSEYTIMETIHHEIFHIIHAHLERKGSNLFSEWKKLNREGFEYLGKFKDFKEACRHDPMMRTRKMGFVSNYSQTNVKEDLCEVYEFLVASKWHRDRLNYYLEGDLVLNAKVNYMNDLLKKELGLRILVKEDIALVKESFYRLHQGKKTSPQKL